MDIVAEALEIWRSEGELGRAWELIAQAAQDRDPALRRGLEMIESLDFEERGIGCELLRSVSDLHSSARGAVAEAMARLEVIELDPDVHWSIARALGSTWDDRAIPGLLRLARHPDEDVRFEVARSLPMGSTAPEVIRTLIELSADPDEDVRNWATFGLGNQCDEDSPEIRTALWARTTDPFPDAREEAIVGLARRRDRLVIPLAIEFLEQEDHLRTSCGSFALLRDPALLPALEDWECESESVKECDPQARAELAAFAAALLEVLYEQAPDVGLGVFSDLLHTGLTLTWGNMQWAVEDLAERTGGDPLQAADQILVFQM